MARISTAICVLLLIVSMNTSCEASPFVVIKKYYDIAVKIYGSIEKVTNGIESDADKISTQIADLKRDISNQLGNVNKNIENMKNNILQTITDKLRSKISVKIDTLFGHINDIDSSFKVFYKKFTNQTVMAKEQLKRFAEAITLSDKTGLSRTVELMHETFVNPDYMKKESVISIIAIDSKAADTICIKGLSSQQMIYDLYNVIAKADAKALMVELFAYDILKDREKDDTYDDINVQTKQQHLQMLNGTFELVKHFMHMASREVWRCDPPKLEKGINYEKLQEVFQGYFLYKADLTVINELYETWGPLITEAHMLSYKCHHFKDERLRCGSDICKAQPSNKVCMGHIRDCSFVYNQVQVCHAPPYDDRRYIWAHLMGTDVYYADRSQYCPDTQGMIGYFPQEICYCNCESEKQEELRYFNLRESTSDIDQNKVVTGVQLVVDKYVFHIRIQQGLLSKDGTIVGKPEWKEIDRIPNRELVKETISKHTIKTLSKSGEKYRFDEWTEWYKNDLVYAVHYKQKTVFLDDFDSPDGSKLVTGLRFKQVGDALRLEVRMTPFDYATGKLDVDAPNQWISNPNEVKDRYEVCLDTPDDPKLSMPSTVFSQSNSYIQFRTTDMKKDVGQNTIPFIDLQPVVTISETPFPLSGVGLFHRHDERTGGFLALKVHHFDYTPYISIQ